MIYFFRVLTGYMAGLIGDVLSLAFEGFPCHEGGVPTGREISRVGSLWVNSITAGGFALSADWLCA